VLVYSLYSDSRPGGIVAIFNRFDPQIFGGKTGGCMEIMDGDNGWSAALKAGCKHLLLLCCLCGRFGFHHHSTISTIHLHPATLGELVYSTILLEWCSFHARCDTFSLWVEDCCVVGIGKLADIDQ
jgi:hypothetical protein